jgi:MoxR-like ATPase
MELWTEKYRPLFGKDIIGHADIVNSLTDWLSNWKTRKGGFFLWGSPGVGKTDAVKDWAKKNGYKVVTRMLAQITPGDLSIPYVDNKVLRFAPAGFLADLKEGEKTILFLDELTAAPPEVATQVYELLDLAAL